MTRIVMPVVARFNMSSILVVFCPTCNWQCERHPKTAIAQIVLINRWALQSHIKTDHMQIAAPISVPGVLLCPRRALPRMQFANRIWCAGGVRVSFRDVVSDSLSDV